jgi:hypothetical protein
MDNPHGLERSAFLFAIDLAALPRLCSANGGYRRRAASIPRRPSLEQAIGCHSSLHAVRHNCDTDRPRAVRRRVIRPLVRREAGYTFLDEVPSMRVRSCCSANPYLTAALR